MFLRKAAHRLGPVTAPTARGLIQRHFSFTPHRLVVKPVVLADIGEGIVECEVIQWFVQPGARVEEFSPLCEVQSDKASVEITSRFAGIVKKLRYEAGEMAKVGQPFVDIDIGGGDIAGEGIVTDVETLTEGSSAVPVKTVEPETKAPVKSKGIATPAVRFLSKQHGIDLSEIEGTGKDGRVLKEDIQNFLKARDTTAGSLNQPSTPANPIAPISTSTSLGAETMVPLTPTQAQMFKAMTKSLSIPHFLYADEIDLTALRNTRTRLNKMLSESKPSPGSPPIKLSYLPFIIKAISIALQKYPSLTSRLDTTGPKPLLVQRSQHNIGIAMDTPTGLTVPVIQDVFNRSLLEIAAEISRLQALGMTGKLTPADLSGGTFTVSNIGSIGGTYTAPIIVEKEVAIVAVGRIKRIPGFGEGMQVVEKYVANFSWTADHRVIDGAEVARASEVVRGLLEDPQAMLMYLR